MHCGELFAGELELQQADALAALGGLAGVAPAQSLQGRFRSDGRFVTDGGDLLELRFGDGPLPAGFLAHDLPGRSGPVSIAALSAAGAPARLEGWLSPDRRSFNLLQLSRLADP